MTEEDDIDGLAAEYVLGSLDPAERRQVDLRRRADRSLADAIKAWERRLGPLSDREPGAAPPVHVLDGVLSRIAQGTPSARTAQVIPLPSRSGRRWTLTVGASTLAACLAVAFGLFNYMQPGAPVHARMDCSKLYKDFWEQRDPAQYAKITPEQLAGVSRMALRAYDACEAGDEQDARALFERLQRMQF
jgi:anti-sigma-K factor RskA